MTDRERITAKIAEVLERPAGEIVDDAALTDIVPGSFVLVELVIELQEEFGVRFEQSDVAGIRTVCDLVNLVVERSAAGETG
jgi:acyl carrier protein